MGSVIVAIPRYNDPTWDISSEDKPHITLMYMGDELGDEEQIHAYLRHLTVSGLNEFHLRVAGRGPLGPDKADVLFFNKNDYAGRDIQDIRSYLLAQPDIRRAYDAVEQYPEWVPHLTLGYPDKPATEPEFGLPYAVHFDRIALWKGDSTGTEYQLSTEEDEIVRMSAVQEIGANALAHYGIKGMKWGVRRADPKPESGHPKHEDAIAGKTLAVKGRNSGRDSLSNAELRRAIERWNLEQQYIRMRPKTPGEKVSSFITNLLGNIGQETINAYTKFGVQQVVRAGTQSTVRNSRINQHIG